jgi:hypothetical protein
MNNLSHLTDKELLKDVSSLVGRERELLSHILWHLKEIDQRKLYSDMKCGSLFEYCVKILKYSEGQASRRVTASRLLKELPHISKEIEKGELNLTQLNQAKHFFHEENMNSPVERDDVLNKIKGKTTRESERILWSLKKEDSPRKVSLVLNEATFEALKEVQDLKAHACPDLDSLLLKMVDVVNKKWNPETVQRKRKETSTSSRYISVQIRAQVWKRDGGKCKICGSQYALELDHIRPFAVGGETTINNLRLLCRNCNQRKGQVYFIKTSGAFSGDYKSP